jgi:PAS domain S-box-containing protein
LSSSIIGDRPELTHFNPDSSEGPQSGESALIQSVLSGGGEMGALIRAFDWSRTPLGPLSQWPQSLRIAVRILLGTGYPMLLCWGSQYTMIYNDGYRPILGKTKHPAALGSPIRQVFTEAMDFIGPRFDNVMARGEDFTVTDQLFILDRNDYLEECYFTFSYSPAPADDGNVGGVLVTALETTGRVLDDRRRRILRELAAEMAKAHSEQGVWLAAAATLTSEPLSVPFVALYAYHSPERGWRLAASAGGVSPAMCPPIIDWNDSSTWPFSEALKSSAVRSVEDLPGRFPDAPATSWGVPPERAVVLPIGLREYREPTGFLVAGVSPRREFDQPYREFLERSGEQIATGLTSARAYEEERRQAQLRRVGAEREARLHAEAERERQRLQELLAQAPAAIGLMSGPEHRWAYVNEQYVRVTGRSSASDFLGKTIRESLPEIQDQPFLDLLDEVYRTGKPYVGREVMVILNRSPTGQPAEAYFDFVYQPLTGVDGSVEGVLVHAVEVTDRVIVRKAVEQSEQRFRALVNATSYVVYRMSPDWNEMRQLDGHGFVADRQQPTMNWLELDIFSGDRPAVLQAIQRAMQTKSVFQLEYRVRRADGALGWTQSRAVPLFDERGEITEWFGAATDVTARKQAEEAQRRLAAIVESSNDAIVSKDLNGIITSWNPAAEKMFGYTAEEMVGRSILSIIPPELHHDEERILATIGRGERIEHFETLRLTKSGERIDVSLTISPVRDETGRIEGAAKIARDITQQKRTEHALRTTERLAAVGRLAATVAHEINNPLAAVTNLIYLSKQKAVGEEVREYLTSAEEELERISHLTRQTLGFYRGSKSPTASLGAVVDSTISVFASRVRNKGITLRAEIKQNLGTYAVPSELRQLIGNLLSNSIDAVGLGGRVRIRISAAPQSGRFSGGVRLIVADSGAGIPGPIRSLIFEPFFTTKKDVGTGLGLWICKSIVDRYHGAMRIWSSTVPGRSGTIVSVLLPASTSGQAISEELRRAV